MDTAFIIVAIGLFGVVTYITLSRARRDKDAREHSEGAAAVGAGGRSADKYGKRLTRVVHTEQPENAWVDLSLLHLTGGTTINQKYVINTVHEVHTNERLVVADALRPGNDNGKDRSYACHMRMVYDKDGNVLTCYSHPPVSEDHALHLEDLCQYLVSLVTGRHYDFKVSAG